MAARMATATWEGTTFEGKGEIALASGAFQGPYSFEARMGDGAGTNPEELIAAGHAGCFNMALSLILSEGGNVPDSLETSARVTLRNVEGVGFRITKIALKTTGKVPGLDEDAFRTAAQTAKETCVVSRALAAVEEITLEATLASRPEDALAS